MTSESLRQYPTACELIKSLPPNALSIISITSTSLSLAQQRGFIDHSGSWQTSLINSDSENNPVEAATHEAYEFANRFSRFSPSSPFITLVVTPEAMRRYSPNHLTRTRIYIETERIINVLSVEGLTPEEAKKQMNELIEDNIGRIRMKIKRFG